MTLRAFISGIFLCSISFFNPAFADIVANGSEQQVNQNSSGNQYFPKSSADANGNYIVSYNESLGGLNNAYINLYNSSGTLLTQMTFNGGSSSFSVNDVAMNQYGQFAAVFTDADNAYVQLFNADTSPRFGQFIRLNSDQNLRYFGDSIAINDSGDVTVTWRGQSRTQYKIDLFARQLQFAGYWVSPQLKLSNEPSTGIIYQLSDVAMQNNGDFVLAWSGLASNKMRVYKKDFYRGGAVKRSSRKVYDTTSVHVQGSVEVAMNQANGDYYLTWSQLNTGYGAGNYWRVFTRKYRASGSSTGGLIQVNQATSMWQPNFNSLFDDNGLLVTWSSYLTNDYDIYARAFNIDGSEQSSTTQLNNYTNRNQDFPQVIRLNGNNIVVSWVSYEQDGDSNGIFSRAFTD